jgi:hypothetical protein
LLQNEPDVKLAAAVRRHGSDRQGGDCDNG